MQVFTSIPYNLITLCSSPLCVVLFMPNAVYFLYVDQYVYLWVSEYLLRHRSLVLACVILYQAFITYSRVLLLFMGICVLFLCTRYYLCDIHNYAGILISCAPTTFICTGPTVL